MHHLEKTRKRVTGSSLSQHLGKSVTLLGEFIQLEPNGQVFTLRTSSSDVVTVQLQEPYSSSKMRGLTLRPDDRELFQNIADAERTAFFQSHTDAFKKMWTEEGEVYWLRFLLAFKRNFETSIMVQPQYQFIFEEDEDEKLVSFVFISIHNMFVHCAYSVVHTFVGNIFIAIKHLHNLKETSKVTNPFYTKESREAFRAILGQPDQHENFAPAVIAFALSIYSMFMGAVSILLKRWLKEPDLSEKAKKGIDYTYFYWKPPPDWMDEYFWASCFEKHLADTYKDELPKLLLTANIQNIFIENHDMDCMCRSQTDKSNLFEMFKENSDSTDSDYCIEHKGILKPYVKACCVHSNCHLKIIHCPECLEPYLCEGSEICKITCEKTIAKSSSIKKNSSNFWQKVIVETFSCKQPRMRHASTLAQSNDTQIETFVHETLTPGKIEIVCQRHDEETEFMMELMHDPEMMNTFNQHKRKEEYKNKLRSKFRQKYCNSAKDFEDPSYRMNLFESAQKLWIMGVFEENFSKLKSGKNIDSTNLFVSRECAENTVAMGTSCVLTGRIVAPSVQNGYSSSLSETIEMLKSFPPIITASNEGKSKKKRKQKKKKNKLNGGDEKKCAAPSTSVENKTDIVDEPEEFISNVTVKVECISTKQADSALDNKNPIGFKIVNISNPKLMTNKTNSANIEKQEPTASNFCFSIENGVEDNIDKEDDKHCIPKCLSSNQSTNECSLKADCSCVLCKKKELSDQNDTLQDNTNIITENPEMTDKVNLKRKICDVNDIKRPINNKSSPKPKEKAIVNQNIKQQPVDHLSSCEIGVKIEENCVIEPDSNVSSSDVLDKNEAVNALTFESEEEKTVEDFLTLIGVISKPSISKDDPNPTCADSDANQKGDTIPLDRKLKVCAFCGKKEVTYKTFKRCAKCKAENFPEQLYYCSRQCQVDDWQESHRDEHLKRSKK